MTALVSVEAFDALDHVEAELEWLDRVLVAAVTRQRAEGRWRGEDDLRGVYVSGELAEAVVAGRSVPFPGLADARPSRGSLDAAIGETRPDLPLPRIWSRFDLDGFERFALLLALAPELDARYRPVLGYLNDDVAQGAPTVALALDLYAGAGPSSAFLRGAFRVDATLVRYRLVRLRPPAAGTSLAQHSLDVDEWVVARALGDEALDPLGTRLRTQEVASRSARLERADSPVVVVATDRQAALDEAAAGVGRRLLVLDLDDLPESFDAEGAVRLAARRARLDGDALALPAKPLLDAGAALLELVGALAGDPLPIAVTAEPAEADRLPDPWPRRRLPPVSLADRRARWRGALAAAGVEAADDAVDVVAGSHPIALDRIDAAAARLAAAAPSGPRSAAELRSAARAVARHGLGGLARRVPPGRSWDDLVLPARTMRQLREIAAALAHRPRVLDDWGFRASAAGGRGMHVLFSGPSGTGKTLAASVIAEEAGYELFAVDLARVVDKYLGETEKHLDRVFVEASAAGAVLLFDEADALFGQRAEVHDARDRYANVEIAYLLQRLEAHEGVTILATNLAHHLDDAFSRRLHHRVDFPVPDAELRRRLWRVVLPTHAPLDADLDLDLVAERFELAGGAIRNAALTAAYLAAADGRPIAMTEVVQAIARELEKAGRGATRADFRELYELLGPADPGP